MDKAVMMIFINTFSIILLMLPPAFSTIMLEKGDIEIDVLLGVTEPRDESLCRYDDINVSAVEIAQAFSYVINELNNDTKLLPFVSMGLAVFDTCEKREWTKLVAGTILRNHEIEEAKNRIFTPAIVMYPSYLPSMEEVRSTFTRSRVLNVELDFWGSSPRDVMNEAKQTPSFHFRYVSPQMLAVRPIKDFLAKYNWTYVSLVTSEKASGFMVAEALMSELKSAGICIAAWERIPTGTTNEQVYHQVIQSIISKRKARVILTLLDEKDIAGLAKAFDKLMYLPYSGHFTWITFDNNATYLSKAGMVFNFEKDGLLDTDSFARYYSSLTRETNYNNPWFSKALEFYSDCTLKGGLFGLDCESADHPVNTERRPLDIYYSTIRGAVRDYASALDKAMESTCKNTTRSPDSSDHCMASVNETMVRDNMRNIYDQTHQKFSVQQIFPNHTSLDIGTWNGEFNFLNKPQWEVLQSLSDDHQTYAPTSVCSSPCPHGHKAVHSDKICCWVCVKI